MARSSTENLLLSLAGEHAVASQLSIRGYVASLTLKNFPGVDIFFTSPKSARTESIQVKTTKDSWVRLQKEPQAKFTVLVDFTNWKDGNEPDFYIMPSKIAYSLALKDRHYHTEEAAKKGKKINEDKWPIALNLLSEGYWQGLEQELRHYKGNWKILE